MQTTHRSLIDLDHPMLKVGDPAQARAAYQRLGFTVSPFRSNDPMGGGTTGGKGGNHLVMLTPQAPDTTNMIELAYCDHDFAWPALKELLSGPAGLALLVHSPTDAQAVHAEWEAAGIACDPVFEVKTDFHDPETGRKDLIHFKVAQPSGKDWLYPFGAAQILDFSHYLREDWCTHQNGAKYWSRITLLVPPSEMQAGAEHLRKVYGAEPARTSHGGLEYRLRNLAIRIMPDDAAGDLYPGIPLQTDDAPQCHTALTIVVGDMDKLLALLEKNGVQAFVSGGAAYVAPRDACGVLLEFTEG